MERIRVLLVRLLVVKFTYTRLSKQEGRVNYLIFNQSKQSVFFDHFFRSQKFLNTNKEIVAMCTGRLDPTSPNEMLFIGSRTNLLAYGKLKAKPHNFFRCWKQQRCIWQGGVRWCELLGLWYFLKHRCPNDRSRWQLFHHGFRLCCRWAILDGHGWQCGLDSIPRLGWGRWGRAACGIRWLLDQSLQEWGDGIRHTRTVENSVPQKSTQTNIRVFVTKRCIRSLSRQKEAVEIEE